MWLLETSDYGGRPQNTQETQIEGTQAPVWGVKQDDGMVDGKEEVEMAVNSAWMEGDVM